MTAGKVVDHSDMPKQTDGLVRGFQLWLNLPKEKKMIEPAYHDISADQIPCIKTKISSVKIISGEYQNTKGPGRPHTGFLYFDVNIIKTLAIKIKNNEGTAAASSKSSEAEI